MLLSAICRGGGVKRLLGMLGRDSCGVRRLQEEFVPLTDATSINPENMGGTSSPCQCALTQKAFACLQVQQAECWRSWLA